MPLAEQFDFSRATRSDNDKTAREDEQRVNFESIWCTWPDDGPETVTVGDGADFDAVIVTVPVAALGRVSKQWQIEIQELARRGRRTAVEGHARGIEHGSHAVNTTLGQQGHPRSRLEARPGSFPAFVHPFDTWADLSHLIGVEERGELAGVIRARGPVPLTFRTEPSATAEVPSNEVHGVHYFCSVLPERQIPGELRAGPKRDQLDLDHTHWVTNVRDTVRDNGRYFLDEWLFRLWPDAVYRYPTAFKWTVLVDPMNRSGANRLEGQHVVANVDPSDRYS